MLSVMVGTGLYEQQDPQQQEHNLRGKFVTNENGEYSLYCLRPTPYPVSVESIIACKWSFWSLKLVC